MTTPQAPDTIPLSDSRDRIEPAPHVWVPVRCAHLLLVVGAESASQLTPQVARALHRLRAAIDTARPDTPVHLADMVTVIGEYARLDDGTRRDIAGRVTRRVAGLPDLASVRAAFEACLFAVRSWGDLPCESPSTA